MADRNTDGDQQRVLRAFFDTNCQSHGLKSGTAGHKDLSDRIMALWNASTSRRSNACYFPDRPGL